MDLKRSNNNKLIYIKKKPHIFFLFFEIHIQKNWKNKSVHEKTHLYSFTRLDLSSPIFIFRIQNSQNRVELVRSHQNAMFRSNRFISPPFFLFFIRQNTRIYVYTHIHNCSVQFRNSWEGLSRFKPEPTPPHSSSSWPFGVTLSSVQGGRFSIGLDSPGKTHYRY